MNTVLRILRFQWDRTLAAALVVGGLVAVVVAWLLASDTILTFEQIPYLMSGGLIGVCLVAIGATLWLSADLRDEWRKLDRIDAGLRRSNELAEQHRSADTGSSPQGEAPSNLPSSVADTTRPVPVVVAARAVTRNGSSATATVRRAPKSSATRVPRATPRRTKAAES